MNLNDFIEKQKKSPLNKLNPNLWSEDSLKPEIRKKLFTIAKSIIKHQDLKSPVSDIQLLGSNASYNWNKMSDIDLHIIINFSKINSDKDLVKRYLDGEKWRWNTEHDIQIKGAKVELYFQDVDEKPISAGIFSIMKNKWIKHPTSSDTTIDSEKAEQKYHDIALNINRMIKYYNEQKIDYADIYRFSNMLLEKIYTMRQIGLTEGGENSPENLAFKKLRNRNFIDKLKQLIEKSYDKFYSIKES